MPIDQTTLAQRELPRSTVRELFLRIEGHLGMLDSAKDTARRECQALASRLAAYGDDHAPSDAYVEALEADADMEAHEQRPATRINALAVELGDLAMRLAGTTAAFEDEKRALMRRLETYEGPLPMHTAAGTPLHPEG